MAYESEDQMSDQCGHCGSHDHYDCTPSVGSCGHELSANATGGWDCLICTLASLAELRKRMGEADKVCEAVRKYFRFSGGPASMGDALAAYDRASPPSPAPTDPEERIVQLHKSCGCVTCVCESETQCGGCGAKNCGNHPSPAPKEESHD